MGKTWIFKRRAFILGALAALAGLVRPASAARCSLTEPNPAGPFYLPGAPLRSRLAPEDFPGERLRISGRVLGADGCTPLAGAMVDVWHASSAGYYYGMEATPPLKPEHYLLRGRIATGADGSYAFDSILPGRYRITETLTRPRHIHYRITHPDHRELITQLYFEGDPHNGSDPLVRSPLIIPLRPRSGGGSEGTFDIVLGPA